MAPKKKMNFWEDPTFQTFFNPMMEQGLASRNSEQNRLNKLRTDVFGVRGALADNKLQGEQEQKRLAEEAAYRGGIASGAYAGTNGAAVQSQAKYNDQAANLTDQYNNQANPMGLLEQGLKMNPDGSISPLAPGEAITDATGKKSKYNWAANTSSGRQAKANALAQYAMFTAKTKV